jgi:hypothetical protein
MMDCNGLAQGLLTKSIEASGLQKGGYAGSWECPMIGYDLDLASHQGSVDEN